MTDSRPKKRSLTLHGHRTSVSLEEPFWRAYIKIAAATGKTINGLAAEIDDARLGSSGLATAIRIFVLNEIENTGATGIVPHDPDNRLSAAGLLAVDGVEIHKANDVRPQNFAIVGERCSGTNLAAHLVSSHLKLKFDDWKVYGWKHGIPQKGGYAPNTLLIVTFRDPVAWIKSLYRKPWHATLDVQSRPFSDFMRMPWHSVISPAEQLGFDPKSGVKDQPLQFDRHPITGNIFKTPFDMRNVKNRAFLGLRQRSVNVAFVRMESLIQDPKLILSCLSVAFDLPMPRKVLLPNNIFGAYQRRVPMPSAPPDNLGSADMDFIRSQLDLTLEAQLGYQVQNSISNIGE